jgi:hypothetical protein
MNRVFFRRLRLVMGAGANQSGLINCLRRSLIVVVVKGEDYYY